MRFYQSTRFLFPRQYELRLLLVCFLAVHVPLIACIAFQAITLHWDFAVLSVILIATLTGTAMGLFAIHALLAPVGRAIGLLEAIQGGQRIEQVPVGGDDLVGRLFQGVATAANESATRIARLIDAAERDALTGLRNRRGFLDSAEAVLQGNSNSVIAVIDIDHFKLINDQFGHAEGDVTLARFAGQLADSIRRSDIAGRWGGEEFIVLFVDTTLEEARMVLERLRIKQSMEGAACAVKWPVTFSCGMAALRSFAHLESATASADAALYRAKEAGRDRLLIAE